MERVEWTFGREYLCLGISWRTGVACLDVVDVESHVSSAVALTGRRLGLRAGTPGRYCTGRYAFVDQTATEHVPCPAQEPTAGGGQCPRCASADEFRFVHHMHTGGHASPALVRYTAQPHWIYIATFADGTSKVGTAADSRKKSRVDEQGAAMATYLARASDGRGARHAEDAVTNTLAVTQSRRRTAKVAALASPGPWEKIAREHAATVSAAVELLEDMSRTDAGLAVRSQPWVPPAEIERFLHPPSSGGWVPYPHDLQVGEHGFYTDACAGQAILARTEPSDDAVRYVVDAGRLKGTRVVAGTFVSPESAVQGVLF